MVCIANHPIPHGICSGIGAGRDVRAVCAVLGQAVLHGAIVRHAARGNQRLLIAVVGQGVCRRRGDRAGRDGGLGDGQLLFGALHRIAVLGGGEIDGVFSDRIEGVIFCILPTGIARLRQGDGRCFALLQNGERHIRAICIAAGAELDGRAALHLVHVRPIDLQIQGLGGDGQAIDDNVVQLRAFDIIRGVPLVSAFSVEHLVSKCFKIQNIFPCRAICQRQCADHGGKSRPGEFRTIESNDLINAGCGRVFRIAQGGGVAARSRLDRHRALDGMAVQIKSCDLRAVYGIIAGHVGQQREFCAAVSVCVKGCLQISKSPLQAAALAIVQGCFSHRRRVAVGTGSGVFVKAVLAAVGAGLYHQVAGLGSGFLQRELRVATVVSKPRILGKQIAQCDAVIQPQTLSRNLSAVQLDCTAPNLQLEQGGAVILRIKYQCTAVPHGHSHRAVAAAAVNDRQVAGANLARGRKAAHIQAVPTQAMSVQIQREGLAGIYAARQHPVCQQGDGAAICGLVKDLSQRIIGAVLSGGLHVQLVRCDTHAIGTLHPHRKRRAAASTLIVAGILVMGTRRVADVADAVREAIVRTYEAAVADVDVGLERIRVGILRILRAMLVCHHDNVLGQLFYISVDEFIWMIFLRKSKPIAQQAQHIAVSFRALYRNAVCTVACDNRAFLQATLQLAPVLDQQAAGKVCLAFEFQRTSVLALLIVIYKDSRHRRSCRLGNRYFIADDQLAALYVQR